MAKFSGLLSSSDYKDADVDGKLQMVNDHWDAVSLSAPEDQRERVESFREVSIGGIEAHARSLGDSYQTEAAEEAKQYDRLWATMNSKGATPEQFNAAVAGVDSARKATENKYKADAAEINQRIEKAARNRDALMEVFSPGGRDAAALTAINLAGDKSIDLDSDGEWEHPLLPLTRKIDEEEAESKPLDRKFYDSLIPGAPLLRRAAETGLKGLADAPAAIVEGASLIASQKGARSNLLSSRIKELQQRTGMSDDEVRQAWADMGNENRTWTEAEPFRVLSSGQIIANPSAASVLRTDEVTQAVKESTAPQIAKADFLGSLEANQEIVAENLAENLAAFSDSHGLAFEDFSEVYMKGKRQNQSTKDIVLGYVERNKNDSTFKDTMGKLSTEGMRKLGQTAVGAGATLTGAEGLQDLAAAMSETTAKISAGAPALVGESGTWDKIVTEAPSIAAMALITRGIGAGTSGATTLRGATARQVLKGGGTKIQAKALQAEASQKAGRTAMMMAGPGYAGLQSAALTYGDEFSENMKKGMSREKAHDLAQGKSFKAGVTTGVITGAFNLTSFSGLEGAIAGRNATVGALKTAAKTRGIPYLSAVKRSMGKFVRHPIIKGGLGEGAEEGLDELVQAFVLADDNEPIADVFGNAWDASKVGAAIGSISAIPEYRRAANAKKTKTADKKAREKARAKLAEEGTVAEVSEDTATPPPLNKDFLDEVPAPEPEAEPEDQRPVGSIIEEWEADGGRVTGLRLGEEGVVKVVKDNNGEWVERGGEEDLTISRRKLIEAGYKPVRGVNAKGEEVTFDKNQQEVQLDAAGEVIRQETDRAIEEMRAAAQRATEAQRSPTAPASGEAADTDPRSRTEGQGAIDPEQYTDERDKAAAQVLVDAGVTTMDQALELANDPDLEGTATSLKGGITAPALVQALTRIFNSDASRLPGVLVDEGAAPAPTPAPTPEPVVTPTPEVEPEAQPDATPAPEPVATEVAPETTPAEEEAAPKADATPEAEVVPTSEEETTYDPVGSANDGYNIGNTGWHVRKGELPENKGEWELGRYGKFSADGNFEWDGTFQTRKAAIDAVRQKIENPDATTEAAPEEVVPTSEPTSDRDKIIEEGSLLATAERKEIFRRADAINRKIELNRTNAIYPGLAGIETIKKKGKSSDLALKIAEAEAAAKESNETDTNEDVPPTEDEGGDVTPTGETGVDETPVSPELTAAKEAAKSAIDYMAQENGGALDAPDVATAKNLIDDAPDQAAAQKIVADATAWNENPANPLVEEASAEANSKKNTADAIDLEFDKDNLVAAIGDALHDETLTEEQAGQLATDTSEARNRAEVAKVRLQFNKQVEEEGGDPLDYEENFEDGTFELPTSENRISSQTPVSITAAAVQQFVRSLSSRFNVKIDWVADLPDTVFGEYDQNTGRVKLNANRVRQTAETPFHEISHAVLAAIRVENPALYAKLAEDFDNLIDDDPQLQRLRARIVDAYPDINANMLQDEMMAQYLGFNGSDAVGKLIDTANDATKSWASKVWKAITDFMKREFGSRLKVSDIDANTTWGQLIDMMSDPAQMFDVGGKQGQASTKTRQSLYNYGSGIRMSARAVLASIQENGAGVAWSKDASGRPILKMIFGSDGKQDVQTAYDASVDLNTGTTLQEWHGLSQRLSESKEEVLGDAFWKGNQSLRAKVNKYVTNPTATQLRTIIDKLVMNSDPLRLTLSDANKGKLNVNDIEEITVTLNELGIGEPAIRTDITGMPNSFNSELKNALAPEATWLEAAAGDPGVFTQLTDEQVSQLRDVMQARDRLGGMLMAEAADPNATDESVFSSVRQVWEDEYEAAQNLPESLFAKLEKRGVTKEDFNNNNIDPDVAAWVNKVVADHARKSTNTLESGVYDEAPTTPPTPVEGEVIKTANETLSDAEKKSAAKALGFTDWSVDAAKAFSSRMTDFIVSGVEAIEALADLFRKVIAAMATALTVATVAISVTPLTTETESMVNVSEVLDWQATQAAAPTITPSRLTADGVPTAQGGITPERAAVTITPPDAAIPQVTPAQEVAPAPPITITPQPAFGNTEVSDNARSVAEWIVGTEDNKGLPFMVADKTEGTTYVFDADGKLIKKAPALFGASHGDITTKERLTKTMSEIRNSKTLKTTPSGRFPTKTSKSRNYGEVVPIAKTGKNSRAAIHKVFTGRPEEDRPGRLESNDGARKRITLGCINVSGKIAKFLNDFFRTGGIVYITPETQEGKDAFAGFSQVNVNDRNLVKRQQAAQKPQPTGRISIDGTVDSLFSKIPDTAEWRAPGGYPGKVVPNADSSNQKGFPDIQRARAHRAKLAAREGLESPMNLKVVSQSKDGVVTYFVVVPSVLSKAYVRRVSRENAPPDDLDTLKDLSTLQTNLPYLANSGNNLIKLVRRTIAAGRTALPEGWWLHKESTDQEALGDTNLETVVQNNILQNEQGRNWASIHMAYLRAQFGNAFEVDLDNPASDTYGMASGIDIPAGKSPYIHDILQDLMVDPNAYPLTIEQTELVNKMRDMMEQMREMMRAANLDKEYLKTLGLDTQDFLLDPKKGAGSPRHYFPRMVLGHYDNNGKWVAKEYIGPGSAAGVKKGNELARMSDENGKWYSMQQIANGDENQQSVVYNMDPISTLEVFLNQGYSSIAAADLAQNLEPFMLKQGGNAKATLREFKALGIPVVGDATFSMEDAKYLDDKLVKNQQEWQALASLAGWAGVSKSIVLGGADIAAPATIAAYGTLTQPFRSLDGTKNLAQNFVGNIMDIARSASTDPEQFNKLVIQMAPRMMEMATLHGKFGSGLDWHETAQKLELNARMTNDQNGQAYLTQQAKAKGSGYLLRLSDFHRNFTEIAKVQMWETIRNRFTDENGDLFTDQESISQMQEEVRSIDRGFGYSNDVDLSMMSRNMRNVMMIATTAPGMYISMFNNLFTKNGAKHTAQMFGAMTLYYAVLAMANGMDDREIMRRLDPRKSGFMTIDIDMGSAGTVKLGMSHFHKSLMVGVAKSLDNANRIMEGEILTMEEITAPVVNFGRSRVSPFASMLIGLYTNEDYMGNRVSKAKTITDAYLPVSFQEPMAETLDRVTGEQIWQTAEDSFTRGEQTLGQKTAGFIFSVMGMNSYPERTWQTIKKEQDIAAREAYGKNFEDLSAGEAAKVADVVYEEYGDTPRFKNMVKIAEWQARENERFMLALPRNVRSFVKSSGAMGSLRVSGGIKLDSGAYVSLDGLSKSQLYIAAGQDAIRKEGGLAALMKKSSASSIHPAYMRKEIEEVLRSSISANNEKVKSSAGITN